MKYLKTNEALFDFMRKINKSNLKKWVDDALKSNDIEEYVDSVETSYKGWPDSDSNDRYRVNFRLSMLSPDSIRNLINEIYMVIEFTSKGLFIDTYGTFDVNLSALNAGSYNGLRYSDKDPKKYHFGADPMSGISSDKSKYGNAAYIEEKIKVIIDNIKGRLDVFEEEKDKIEMKSAREAERSESSRKEREEIEEHNKKYLNELKKILDEKEEIADYFIHLEDISDEHKMENSTTQLFLTYKISGLTSDLVIDDKNTSIISNLNQARKRIEEVYPNIKLEISIKQVIKITISPKIEYKTLYSYRPRKAHR